MMLSDSLGDWRQERSLESLLFVLFLVAVAFTGALTLWDYGMSWDEVFRARAGEVKYEYYQALLTGDYARASEIRSSGDNYPGLYDLTNAVLRRLIPLGWVEIAHVLNFLFGISALIGTYLVAKILLPRPAALLAPVFLLLMPRFYGHMYINPKDIPFAATFIWGIWGILRVRWSNNEIPSVGSAVVLGLFAGLCMSVRLGGLLLIPYAGVTLLTWIVVSVVTQGSRPSLGRGVRMCGIGAGWLSLTSLVGFVFLMFWWPALHKNPFERVSGTFETITKYGWEGTTLYFGKGYVGGETPWHYLPVMLTITMPLFILFIFLSGLPAFAMAFRQMGGWRTVTPRTWKLLLLIFMTVFPIGYIILRDAVVYDGIRHVLFVLPMVAVLVAVFASKTLDLLAGFGRWAVVSWIVIGCLLAFGSIVQMIRLHPYQYTFYNALVGGLRGADGRFETEYWATSFREAAMELQTWSEDSGPATSLRIATIPPSDLVFARFGYLVQAPPIQLMYYLPPRFTYAPIDTPFDVFVSATRSGFEGLVKGEVIFEVERQGVVFARGLAVQGNEDSK